jgi:hypothetical protein
LPGVFLCTLHSEYTKRVAEHGSGILPVCVRRKIVQKKGILRICAALLRTNPDFKRGITPVDSALWRDQPSGHGLCKLKVRGRHAIWLLPVVQRRIMLQGENHA